MATVPFVQFSSFILYYIGVPNSQATLSTSKNQLQDPPQNVSSTVVPADAHKTGQRKISINSLRIRHIAISTKESFHGEVYDAFAWHVIRVSRMYPKLNITVDIYEQEAMGDFTAWMQDLGMVTRPVKTAKDLRSDISRTDLFGDGRMIDLVIPASAETDVDEHSDYLWEAYAQRPVDQKFELASIMHHGHNTEHWGHLSKWSRLRLFRYFFISEHVARKARSLLQSWGDRKDTRGACFEYIRTDVFVPILDLSSIIIPKERDPPRGLFRVAIQGNFDQYMRDYEGTFRDLVLSFKADPAAWGYLPLRLDDEKASYQPDPMSAIPSFELHLLGGRGKLNIPHELKDVVKVHFGLESKKYWTVLQSMHVIVPAFSRGDEYYTCIASSSCHSAMQCNVPLLVTRRLRESYTYLEDSVTIVRPQAISEVQAIKALRTGVMPEIDYSLNPSLEDDMKRMIAEGWRRSTSQFDAFKQKIWTKNDELVTRVLCGE